MKYIVALEISKESGNGLSYIAPWSGDPGRTCLHESAKRYPSISAATFGLAHARTYRDFRDAEIREVEE